MEFVEGGFVCSQNFKVVVFDMDGTLIKGASCWEILHKYFRSDPKLVKKNMEDYLMGRISYCEWMRRDLLLWKQNNRYPHISEVKKALKNYEMVEGAYESIKELKRRGYITAIVTGGLDILAKEIARKLGIEYIYANGFKTDENGYLTEHVKCIVDPCEKGRNLMDLSKKLKTPLSTFIAVGDTRFDLSMFKIVGLSIAFNPKDEIIEKHATIVIKNNSLFKILEYIP